MVGWSVIPSIISRGWSFLFLFLSLFFAFFFHLMMHSHCLLFHVIRMTFLSFATSEARNECLSRRQHPLSLSFACFSYFLVSGFIPLHFFFFSPTLSWIDLHCFLFDALIDLHMLLWCLWTDLEARLLGLTFFFFLSLPHSLTLTLTP